MAQISNLLVQEIQGGKKCDICYWPRVKISVAPPNNICPTLLRAYTLHVGYYCLSMYLIFTCVKLKSFFCEPTLVLIAVVFHRYSADHPHFDTFKCGAENKGDVDEMFSGTHSRFFPLRRRMQSLSAAADNRSNHAQTFPGVYCQNSPHKWHFPSAPEPVYIPFTLQESRV